MFAILRASVVMLVLFIALLGVAYPLAVTGIAQAAFPNAANGSPLERDGTVIGSSLIGQDFASERYFHGRPSATADAPYNAASSSGSNYGPTSQALLDQVKERAATYGGSNVPADLVTASGSGLDPDISPAGALAQVERVATARNLDAAAVRTLVEEHVDGALLGLIGQPHVNVLRLNLALDRLTPT